MKIELNQIGIVTKNFTEMKEFYQNVMNFKPLFEADEHVEFENKGIRFAISNSQVMEKITEHESYKKPTTGQSFELAFKVDSPEEVDQLHAVLVGKGAKDIKKAADMPWKQRTAFFADPDGNIHEVFADL